MSSSTDVSSTLDNKQHDMSSTIPPTHVESSTAVDKTVDNIESGVDSTVQSIEHRGEVPPKESGVGIGGGRVVDSQPAPSTVNDPPAPQTASDKKNSEKNSHVSAQTHDNSSPISDAIQPKKYKVNPLDFIHVRYHGKNREKIKKAFALALKYDGDLRQAMLDAGYSESTARNPGRVTESAGWKEMLDHYFPINTLMSYEKKLLDHKDWRAWNAALDRLHKLRGSFVKKVDISVHKDSDVRRLTDAQLMELRNGTYVSAEQELDDDEHHNNAIE